MQKKPFKSDPIRTVLTISMGFLLLFIITKLNWTLKVSAIIGFVGLVSHKMASGIEWLWMKLSLILSFIVPNVLLTLLFFLFLFPISLLSKIFREKDLLFIKNPLGTTFIKANKSFSKESFEKPW